jgi:Ran GTPase-activating protein (RanGAP) involved in mRNA processing and transport
VDHSSTYPPPVEQNATATDELLQPEGDSITNMDYALADLEAFFGGVENSEISDLEDDSDNESSDDEEESDEESDEEVPHNEQSPRPVAVATNIENEGNYY